MAEVKWIKIKTDIFDDEKILLIESLPDSYAIIVVWFKLLCLAGKQNNSGVFMMNNQIAYTDKMLATIFRMKETTVTMALKTFEDFGMIEMVDDVITIPNWDKHQSLDAYEKKKIRDRQYQQERRNKQKLLAQKKSSDTSSDTSTDSSSDVVVSDKDKEEDIDKDIYINIVEYLNQKAGTHYKYSTKKTKTCIHARLQEGFTIDDFKSVIDKKCTEWIGTEWEKFLRPETLFGTKFESYLNAKVSKKAESVNTGYEQEQDKEFMDLIKSIS